MEWTLIDRYFKDHPDFLVQHHLSSYNDFIHNRIPQIIREQNPILIQKNPDTDKKDIFNKAELYIGGKNGDQITYGKPMIYDDLRSHYMYPNEARLRNMTYGFTIHVDVVVVFTLYDDGKYTTTERTMSNILFGLIPIMINSDMCILNGISKDVKYNMGECLNDPGGYFIVDGSEKFIITQEEQANNTIYIKTITDEGTMYSHTAMIRSISENTTKQIRTTKVMCVMPTPEHSNGQLVVAIPNVKTPIPLFIVMRALGILSDKEIIEYCLLDLTKNQTMIELFIPCVHDAGCVFTQWMALQYIAEYTKERTTVGVLEKLTNYFIPHVGNPNTTDLPFKEKAYFLGHMVYKLLRVITNLDVPTDRDAVKNKRFKLSGELLSDLFKEYYIKQKKDIFEKFDYEYTYHTSTYQDQFEDLIMNNYTGIFNTRIVETGIKDGFKGRWGSELHTMENGIVQELSRLTYNWSYTLLRMTNLEIEKSARVVEPHLLHTSQWGLFDPADTPDGEDLGTHKHFAILTKVTDVLPKMDVIRFLQEELGMQDLKELKPSQCAYLCKIIVNGDWYGCVDEPELYIKQLKLSRRIGLLPYTISISWIIQENAIYLFSDAGRPIRPIYYIDNHHVSYKKEEARLMRGDFTWNELVVGFHGTPDRALKVYTMQDLYKDSSIEHVSQHKAVIEYLDAFESETCLISTKKQAYDRTYYTHEEIHPSLLFGMLGNMIIFPESNPTARNTISCGQSKQGISLYHTNFQYRMDKTGVVLNSGHIPLVKSRYLKYINNEQHPYGVNIVVAIMCYTGYNTEDSLIFNQSAIDRGLFDITYYSTYEATEEYSKDQPLSTLMNTEDVKVKNTQGYDYSQLDSYGIIQHNAEVKEKTVLIGMGNINPKDGTITDASVVVSKGHDGYVDKTVLIADKGLARLAKVRIREHRKVELGDKFCSRAGQKGTCGLILQETDMPYTAEGIRPDIIINPHAFPSRMTLGHLIECLMGKSAAHYGHFADCTAFEMKGPKEKAYGDFLTQAGYHRSGCELMYNGITGQQIESQIFIGPNYYLRLKHMVKDKINYRDRGPNTVLTRQPVQGRSNDGGIRIGEMERDGLIAHGMSAFTRDSMMKRSDHYSIAIDNVTGLVAAYNPRRHIFLSPLLDGPLQYTDVLDRKEVNVVSKYGKTFSILKVPYSFNLLLHELRMMNVVMRLITTDGMSNLESMMASDTLQKLMKKPNETVTAIIQEIVGGTWVKEKPVLHSLPVPVPIVPIEKPEPAQLAIGDTVHVDLSKLENKEEYKGTWKVEAIAGDDAMLRQGDTFKLLRSSYVVKDSSEPKTEPEPESEPEPEPESKPEAEPETSDEEIIENLDDIKQKKEEDEENAMKKELPELMELPKEEEEEVKSVKTISMD
jgi:DNA-directed RNA polymerase II subunit RPB2